MDKKTCFIGHRLVINLKAVKEKLYNLVEQQIKNGCKIFTMGTHGEFDKLALNVCKELKRIYNDIVIEVVITSLNEIKPQIISNPHLGYEKYTPYQTEKTVMYDIEEQHYKRKISYSNQQIIDNCDCLICYVDIKRIYGGAILAYKYARKKGLQIINIY